MLFEFLHGRKSALCLSIWPLFSTLPIFAEAVMDKESPTAFLAFDAAYTTHKSELMESNDTGIGVSYTLGFHAGQDRDIGILFRNSTSTISFALNESKIQTTYNDYIIRYRLGPFYLGAVIANVAMKANKEGEDISDTIGSGYGGNLGLAFQFNRIASYYLDVTSTSYGALRELEQRDITIGSRMAIDTGVMFHLTRRVWSILVGVKYSTVAITVDTGGTETISAFYIGNQFSSFF